MILSSLDLFLKLAPSLEDVFKPLNTFQNTFCSSLFHTHGNSTHLYFIVTLSSKPTSFKCNGTILPCTFNSIHNLELSCFVPNTLAIVRNNESVRFSLICIGLRRCLNPIRHQIILLVYILQWQTISIIFLLIKGYSENNFMLCM